MYGVNSAQAGKYTLQPALRRENVFYLIIKYFPQFFFKSK